MKSCRDVSNNDTYDEVYQKAADMVVHEEIVMPRKKERMRFAAADCQPFVWSIDLNASKKQFWTGKTKILVQSRRSDNPVTFYASSTDITELRYTGETLGLPIGRITMVIRACHCFLLMRSRQ